MQPATFLLIQLPVASLEEMRRLADRHGLGDMSLDKLAGYLLQLAMIDQLKLDRTRARACAGERG